MFWLSAMFNIFFNFNWYILIFIYSLIEIEFCFAKMLCWWWFIRFRWSKWRFYPYNYVFFLFFFYKLKLFTYVLIFHTFSRFFVLLTSYFVGGFVYLKFVKKSQGKETIPNVTFWTSLPSDVKVQTPFYFYYSSLRIWSFNFIFF